MKKLFIFITLVTCYLLLVTIDANASINDVYYADDSSLSNTWVGELALLRAQAESIGVESSQNPLGELYFIDESIVFSPENPIADQTVRIYAIVRNDTSEDVKGNVIFKADGRQYGDPQPVSLFANSEDGIYIDVKFSEGIKKVKGVITDASLSEKKSSEEHEITIDGDADNDGIGDSVDDDDDNDGLTDDREATLGTDPNNPDSDGDGVDDSDDLYPTNSNYSKDSDGDGLPDNYEKDHNLNPFNPADINSDQDGDELSAITEYELETNPTQADTDLDGAPDGWEVQYNLNPLDAGDALADNDVDSFTNKEEFERGSDPTFADPEGLEILKQEKAEEARRASPQYQAMKRIRNTIGIIIIGLILVAAGIYRNKKKQG